MTRHLQGMVVAIKEEKTLPMLLPCISLILVMMWKLHYMKSKKNETL
jgi:hypothetical protein